jgi:prevent-host-death family protein
LLDLKKRPGPILERVAAGAPVFLSRRGRTCAVLLSQREYERLVGHEVMEPYERCYEHGGGSTQLVGRVEEATRVEESSPPDGSEAIGPLRSLKVSPDDDVVRVLAAMKGVRRRVCSDDLLPLTGLPVQRVLVALLELRMNGFIDGGGLQGSYSVRSGG